MTQHAITPTASKSFGESLLAFKGAASAAPAELSVQAVDAAIDDDAAPLEPDQIECLAIALELADSAARSDIECEALGVKSLGLDWYDLNAPPCNYTKDDAEHCAHLLQRAARYFQLRGDTPQFRVIRHQTYPNLIRFEAREGGQC